MKRLLAALLAVGALTGCGISAESQPRQLDSGSRRAEASATPAITGTGPLQERLFLVRDGRLVESVRHVPALPELSQLIADLVAGPNDEEKAAGMASALLGTSLVTGVAVDGDHALVDLASSEAIARTDDILAYGQIVCTLTTRPGVVGVQFTSDRDPVDVPNGDAVLSPGPLTCADYATLTARVPTPTGS